MHDFHKGHVSEAFLGWLFVSPVLMCLILLVIIPIFMSLIYSFHNIVFWRGMISLNFVGFKNYITVLTEISFIRSLIQTFIYTILRSVGAFVFGFIIAWIMYTGKRMAFCFKATFLLPWALSYVANSIMWNWLFHGSYGLLNEVLFRLKLINDYKSWLADPKAALYVIIFMDIWKNIPFSALAFYAGLQSIPLQLFEAAKIDGASNMQMIRYIVLPYLRNLCTIVFLFQAIWALRGFDSIWTLTRGGFNTEILNITIYKETFLYLRIGEGAALAFILFLITFIIMSSLLKKQQL